MLDIVFPASVVALGYLGREVAKGIQKHAAAAEEAKQRSTEPHAQNGGSK